MKRMINEKEIAEIAKLNYVKVKNGAVCISTLNNADNLGNAHFRYINSIGTPVEHLHVTAIHLGDTVVKDQNNLIIIDELPVADPEVEGALWNDNGALKISAGAEGSGI